MGKREGWSAHPRGSSIVVCVGCFSWVAILILLGCELTFNG